MSFRIAHRMIAVSMVIGAGIAGLTAATPTATAAPLTLPYLDNESLLTVMQFNMEELFEAQRRNGKADNTPNATSETDDCSINIGTSDDEGQNDFSIFENEPAIIIAGPIINACGQ